MIISNQPTQNYTPINDIPEEVQDTSYLVSTTDMIDQFPEEQEQIETLPACYQELCNINSKLETVNNTISKLVVLAEEAAQDRRCSRNRNVYEASSEYTEDTPASSIPQQALNAHLPKEVRPYLQPSINIDENNKSRLRGRSENDRQNKNERKENRKTHVQRDLS